MIRVLICDDQTVVREGLAAILSTDPEIQIVGLASHGAEALELVPETDPDIILLDLQMPVMNGVQTAQRLRRAYPNLHVLVLTTYAEDQWVLDAVRAGAQGYLLKDARRDELLAAIKGTLEGRSYLDPAIAGTVMHAATSPPTARQTEVLAEPFTQREQEILRLLVQGQNNPEIARRLHLAKGTVRNYVSVIFQKLGVSDRTQAAVAAVQRGLVDDTEA